MTKRIWYELGQIKHNHFYCVFLLARQRQLITYFNIIILSFSSAGIMGWAIWKDFPLASCIIISAISLLRLLLPHILPSEKQLDKLDHVTDFYFDYFNKIEQLWYDYYNDRIDDKLAQERFYELKNTERDINKIINEIVKSTNKKIYLKADTETRNYIFQTFNTK